MRNIIFILSIFVLTNLFGQNSPKTFYVHINEDVCNDSNVNYEGCDHPDNLYYNIQDAITLGIGGEGYCKDASAYAVCEEPTIFEEGYDDGSFEQDFNAETNNYSAVWFSADPAGEDIVRFKWFQNGSGGAFYIKVFEDDGGMPGTEIYSDVIASGNQDGWNEIDLTSAALNVSGDFWIGTKELNARPFGLDTSSDAGHSYLRIGGDGEWAAVNGNIAYHVDLDCGENCDEFACVEGGKWLNFAEVCTVKVAQYIDPETGFQDPYIGNLVIETDMVLISDAVADESYTMNPDGLNTTIYTEFYNSVKAQPLPVIRPLQDDESECDNSTITIRPPSGLYTDTENSENNLNCVQGHLGDDGPVEHHPHVEINGFKIETSIGSVIDDVSKDRAGGALFILASVPKINNCIFLNYETGRSASRNGKLFSADDPDDIDFPAVRSRRDEEVCDLTYQSHCLGRMQLPCTSDWTLDFSNNSFFTPSDGADNDGNITGKDFINLGCGSCTGNTSRKIKFNNCLFNVLSSEHVESGDAVSEYFIEGCDDENIIMDFSGSLGAKTTIFSQTVRVESPDPGEDPDDCNEVGVCYSIQAALSRMNPALLPDGKQKLLLEENSYERSTDFPISLLNGIDIEGGARTGGKPILDPNNQSRAFKCIDKQDINLKDLHIRNGRPDAGSGGAIYMENCSSTFDNISIEQSQTEFGDGGAIYIENSSSTFDTLIIEQSQTEFGDGGALYITRNDRSIFNNSVITNNSTLADDGKGGGIYVKDSSPEFINTDFTNNQSDEGGGIYIENSSPTFSHGVFSSNTSNKKGGALRLDHSDANIDSVHFIGNNTVDNNGVGGGIYMVESSAVLDSVYMTGNRAGRGGGIYMLNSSSEVKTILIDGNTAFNGNGGGLYSDNSNPIIDKNRRGERSQIINNTSYGLSGGGIYTTNGSAIELDGVDIHNNQITISSSYVPTGAGISIEDGPPGPDGSTFSLTDISVLGNGGSDAETPIKGAGIYIYKHTGIINGGFIKNNGFNDDHGGIYIEDSEVIIQSLALTNNTISHTLANNQGLQIDGVIYFSNSDNSQLLGVDIINDIQGYDAPYGIQINNSNGLHFQDVRVIGFREYGISAEYQSDIKLKNVEITGNANGILSENSEITMENVTIADNGFHYSDWDYNETYNPLGDDPDVITYNDGDPWQQGWGISSISGNVPWPERSDYFEINSSIIWNNKINLDATVNGIGPQRLDISYSNYGGIDDGNLYGGIEEIETSGSSVTINWLEGNINESPFFVFPDTSNYDLQLNSPCIDAGDPDLNGDGITWETDTDDQNPDGTRIDMGANYYEQDAVYGCTNLSACNYNSNANNDDGSCIYPEENYDCSGNCIVDLDCTYDPDNQSTWDSACGGSAELDECGVCEGNGIPEGECDCDGNVVDCGGECGGDGAVNTCGYCIGTAGNGTYSNSINTNGYSDNFNFEYGMDCTGECEGSSVVDECGLCATPGDLNTDGGQNILDIISLSICILEGTCADMENSCTPDINSDGIFLPSASETGDDNGNGVCDEGEDANGDGVCDEGEDVNGNDVCDPDENDCQDGDVNGNDVCDPGENDCEYDCVDGCYNIVDLVKLVSCILENDTEDDQSYAVASCIVSNTVDDGRLGRINDASEVKLIKTKTNVTIDSDGYIGGVHLTLQHSKDFMIELTENAFYTNYLITNNETRLLVIHPESNELFSFSGDFEILDISAANSYQLISVDYVVISDFNLSEAYPNPFNPSTNIDISIPVNSNILLQVYDIRGRLVETLINENKDAGIYFFTWHADNYSSGVYLVKMAALHLDNSYSESYYKTRKLLLVK